MINNNELTYNINPLSNPYRRANYDALSTENRYNNNNILKNTGKELIINSKRKIANKYSKKSIFSQNSNSNKKLKKIYDPYLISVCKHAIIKEKRQLPNYREIIRNINTEFGIEESEKNNFEKYNNSPNENKIKLTINIESNNKK